MSEAEARKRAMGKINAASASLASSRVKLDEAIATHDEALATHKRARSEREQRIETLRTAYKTAREQATNAMVPAADRVNAVDHANSILQELETLKAESPSDAAKKLDADLQKARSWEGTCRSQVERFLKELREAEAELERLLPEAV